MKAIKSMTPMVAKCASVVLVMGVLFLPFETSAGTVASVEPHTPAPLLATPYVSDPVMPADTRGLSPAPPVEPYTGEPQDIPTTLSLPGRERTTPAPAAASAGTDSPVVWQSLAPNAMPAALMNWEGISNTTYVMPPDTDGQIGPNHYVQIVNAWAGGAHVGIYSKTTGDLLYPIFALGDLWPSGNPCNDDAYGDPVVLYDQLADRWLLTQFALPDPPYYECIAISKTGTPTNDPNDWHLYGFRVHETKVNDYPKLGVWPDGYYMSANQFTSVWAGAGVWVFDRDEMLQGNPAGFQYFDLWDLDPYYGGLLPSNLMGSTLPPAGAPNYFMSVDMDWSGTSDVLHVFEFHTDWNNPANSTFGLVADLVVDPFNWDFTNPGADVPQPDTSQGVDGLSDRLMMHLWYRNFGDHESLVVNHTVNVGSGRHGIRWYELRGGAVDTTLADVLIYQQGDYAPSDTEHRWMGSVALDGVGNMALGYSVSSEAIYPSIRYTGRLASDPLGTMPQGEGSIIVGSGSQTDADPYGRGRWGDYSAMSVDPVDDCTFWYTQQYIQTTGLRPWQTRIASFRFPSCTQGPRGALEGEVYDGVTTAPVVGSRVEATLSPTQTFSTVSGPDGIYSLLLSPSTYTVTATAYGYLPTEIAAVGVVSGTTTTLDIPLTPAPSYVVSGTVSDAVTGWPLYASIDVGGYPGGTVWNDPVTGYYSITLPAGLAHTFHVNAWVDGYLSLTRDVALVGDMTEDFGLLVDPTVCSAPGYGRVMNGFYETFDETTVPAGWSVVDNAGSEAVWRFDDPDSRGNKTGGAGNFAIADSDYEGYIDVDTELRTPVLDFSGWSTVTLQFKYDFNHFSFEVADVDVSASGASGPWTNVWTRSSDDRGPKTATVDLTAIAAGQSNVMVRFHYYDAYYDWWWQVDDVIVGQTPTCEPAAGGLVVGVVYDGNTALPLPGASVVREGGDAATATPALDEAFYTLFSQAGTRTFTATMSGGYGLDVQTPTVVQSSTIRQDFHLPAGMLDFASVGLSVTVQMGLSTTLPFTLSNGGGLPADYELVELPGGSAPLALALRSEGASGLPSSVRTAASKPIPDRVLGRAGKSWPRPYAPWSPAGPVHLVLDDGTRENDVGIIAGGQFLWLNRFTPSALDFPFTLTEVWVLFSAGSGVSVGEEIDIYIYEDTDGDGDPATGAVHLGSYHDTVRAVGDTTWSVHELDSPVLLNGPGDVLIGVVNRTAGVGSGDYPAAIDQTASQGRSWVGIYTGDPPDPLPLPADDTFDVIDTVESSLAGNWMVRGSGFSGGLDVPWLSEDPVSGTLSVGGIRRIDVAFDAGVPQITQPGVYTAQLKLKHDTPYVVTNVPVTMHVISSCVSVGGLDFDFAPASPAAGQAVVFTASVAQGTGPITYTWDFGDGSGLGEGNPITHSFPLTAVVQTYTVTLTAANACPSQQAVEKGITVLSPILYLPVVLHGY